MRRRRKILYYNGPSSEMRITKRVWFPFAAVAVAALVLGLILGAIFGAIAQSSEKERLTHHDLIDFGGVEEPAEKYGALRSLTGGFVDPGAMSESEFKKALSAIDGNAVCVLVYDSVSHFENGNASGIESGGQLSAERIAEIVDGKSLYSIAYFKVSSFEETDLAERAYERGREMALLAELAEADFREIMLVGLPAESKLADEVYVYISELRTLCGNTAIGVALPGEASVGDLAALVGTTESHADAFALDLLGMSNAEAATVIEQNAYYITQYAMRVMLTSDPEAAEAYDIPSRLLFNEE